MGDTLHIKIGALSAPIKEQLKEQGIVLSEHSVKHLQLDIDAVVRLRIRGLLTRTEEKAVGKRLLRSISREVKAARKGAKSNG